MSLRRLNGMTEGSWGVRTEPGLKHVILASGTLDLCLQAKQMVRRIYYVKRERWKDKVFILGTLCHISGILESGFKNKRLTLPWWSLIKNPSCHMGDAGSIPGEGTKNPHAAEQLSLCCDY